MIVIGIILLLIGSSTVATKIVVKTNQGEEKIVTINLEGNSEITIYVDDDNTDGPWDGSINRPYQTIKDAIENSTDGDIIFVFTGTYTGFTANKRLDIIGENREDTIIEVTSSSNRVRLRADWCNLSDFTITGEAIFLDGYLQAGGNNVTVSNCNVYTQKSVYGIEVGGTYSISGNYLRRDIIIDNCTVKGFHYAGFEVYLSHHSKIENCKVYDCGDGMEIWSFNPPDDIFVNNCEILNNQYGIAVSRDRVFISNCHIYNNTIGVEIYASKKCQVTSSVFENNTMFGCYLRPYHSNIGHIDTKENKILGNLIINNERGICFEEYCKENYVHHNNFINNPQYNALDLGTDEWDDGVSEGNYWDDYTGTDGNGDGIGDTPHRVVTGSYDHYPLINLFSMENKPPGKPIITGGESGLQWTTHKLFVKSLDPNFDSVFYQINWGDGTESGWLGPFPYDENGIVSHTWKIHGTFRVKVRAKDVKGEISDWSDFFEINIEKNNRPTKPTLTGPSEGIVGYGIEFSAVSTDNDREKIRYCFDFDDNIIKWTEYYNSGEPVTIIHSWDYNYLKIETEKTYTLKVKAQDGKGGESEWSEPLIITIKNNPPTAPILINAPDTGKVGEKYKLTVISYEPDNHEISYEVEWGYGSSITGGFKSGEEVTLEWDYGAGDFTIEIRARDEYWAISEWVTHDVTIQRLRSFNRPIFNQLFQRLIHNFPMIERMFSIK
jgi:parallel beta-helix repeat protein